MGIRSPSKKKKKKILEYTCAIFLCVICRGLHYTGRNRQEIKSWSGDAFTRTQIKNTVSDVKVSIHTGLVAAIPVTVLLTHVDIKHIYIESTKSTTLRTTATTIATTNHFYQHDTRTITYTTTRIYTFVITHHYHLHNLKCFHLTFTTTTTTTTIYVRGNGVGGAYTTDINAECSQIGWLLTSHDTCGRTPPLTHSLTHPHPHTHTKNQ